VSSRRHTRFDQFDLAAASLQDFFEGLSLQISGQLWRLVEGQAG
jgi:hypothetical protein